MITLTGFAELSVSLLTIAGLLWSWAYNNGKRDSLEARLQEKINTFLRQVEKLVTWKDTYEKTATDIRIGFEKQFATAESRLALHDGHYDEIIRYFGKLDDKMGRMEKRLDDLHNNHT